MNRIIDAIEKEQFKTDVTKFKIGDGVRVHTRVVEGDKERIQIFAGIVIAMVLVLSINAVVNVVERRALGWRPVERDMEL